MRRSSHKANADPVLLAPDDLTGPEHIVWLDHQPEFIRDRARMLELETGAGLRRVADKTVEASGQPCGNGAGLEGAEPRIVSCVVVNCCAESSLSKTK